MPSQGYTPAVETVSEPKLYEVFPIRIESYALLSWMYLKDHKAGIPNGERAAWLRHFDINVASPAMVIQECLPLLRKAIANGKFGTIVNISGRKGSIELCPGTERVHGNYAYMCSKGMTDPSESAPELLSTVDQMTIKEHSGKFWDRKGRTIPY
ncbi:hypothetical protein TELCIR_05771 [Teladorsagia circumcincta]|uniref:Uncharacterized protein n=1 Tax=Teladorsagia circumcincta TaxID=45464 RepID=A0A2G9URI6_TELCI|nr:hypothetical protein TELCIR_05771 [Teladorsagia circumcincta]